MTNSIQISSKGSLCHVILANAGRCNALTADYITSLTELLHSFRLATDDVPSAVILSGQTSEDTASFSVPVQIWPACIRLHLVITRHGGRVLTALMR